MNKVILSISLAVNIVFTVYFLGIKPSTSENAAEFEHVIFLYELQEKYMSQITVPASQYWKPDSIAMLEMAADKKLSDELIRRDLIDKYGDSAKDMPVFESYFYPLGLGYEFLISDLQIEVANVRDSHQQAMLTISTEGFHALSKIERQETAYWRRLRNLLTAEQLFEYSLRESQLAQQMRTMQFDWNEAEFREIYRIRSQNPPDPTGSQQIKAYLGEQRYQDYILAADPSLAQFKHQAEQSGLRGAVLQAVVDLYFSYGEKIAAAMQRNDHFEAARLSAARDREIAEISGIKVPTVPGLPFRLPNIDGIVEMN